jgi:PAS domain S-box-containing protein
MRFAIPLIGWLQITIGLLVLVAWAVGGLALTQIDARHAPLHFNGAIGLILWGAGLLCLTRGWRTLTQVLSSVLILLGILCLAEYQGVSNWGFDRWAFSSDPSVWPFPPGGMPVPAIAAYIVAGFALIITSRSEAFSSQSLIVALCGVFLLAGAIAIIVGRQNGTGTGPPLLGVCGGLLGGSAILIYGLRSGLDRLQFGNGLPLFVGLAGIVFSVALWQALNTQQSQRIHRTVQIEAAHVDRLLEDNLAARLTALGGIATSLREAPDNEAKIGESAAGFVAQQPGCLGIARVDDQRNVKWLEITNTSRLPRTLGEIGVAESLSPALENGKTAVLRAPRSKWSGTRILVLYAPIDPAVPSQGGLLTAIKLQELFDTILNINVAPGYALSIMDQNELLYTRYASETRYQSTLQQSLPVRLHDARWTVNVWPTPDGMARESLSVPKLALGVGFLTTILLALAVHLAQTARRRARDLEREMRERLQAEGALKQSEAKYRNLIENLEQGVFLKDREGCYIAANRVFCHGIGLHECDVIGHIDAELFAADVALKQSAEDQQVIVEGKRIEYEEERTIDGKKQMIRRILTPVRDGLGQPIGVLGICWDVTEQRSIEARLRQAGKMDAIGQLAGGIAHDFNNLLTAILGNLDLMLASQALGERNRELVVEAQNAAVRAASLTRQLLGFSRQHQLDWEPTDVNALVDEVVTLLGRTIDPRIRIETRKSSENWPVLADSSQLNQVLMNLCLNARDAITGPGRILIETDCVEVTEMQALSQADARVGSFVRLRVGDTGSGMAHDVRAHIFEPFFTTKDVGKGTGLGLAMVFAIVKQHHGWIECQSEVDQGTEFSIYLPRSTELVKAPPAPKPSSSDISKDSATILVVDDEPMIRNLARLVLTRSGFEVIEAEDGQQAVEIYEREHDRIDLVILDLTMPNLSGQEAFRQMWQINPNVKAVFASGYAAEQITTEEQHRILGFVKKPYRPDELVQSIREALKHAREKETSYDLDLVGCEA